MMRLKDNLVKKTDEIKLKLKELHKNFLEVYSVERSNQNKTISTIRKNIDLVKLAEEKIVNIDFSKYSSNSNSRLEEDVKNLQKITLKNLKLIEEYLVQKQNDFKKVGSIQKDNNFKRDIDNVYFAFNDLKKLDLDFEIIDSKK
jgi:hypothetical protein